MRDLKYIARRAQQEREAVEAAQSDHAKNIHAELARRYEEILRAYNADEAA